MSQGTINDYLPYAIRHRIPQTYTLHAIRLSNSLPTRFDNQRLKGHEHLCILPASLKKPEEYKDVRGPLTADYQNELEENWINELRAKYKFEVYDDVLRTVNNH